MSRLWGFRSLCRILWLWMYLRARSSWNMKICKKTAPSVQTWARSWALMAPAVPLTRTLWECRPPGCWVMYWARSVCYRNKKKTCECHWWSKRDTPQPRQAAAITQTTNIFSTAHWMKHHRYRESPGEEMNCLTKEEPIQRTWLTTLLDGFCTDLLQVLSVRHWSLSHHVFKDECECLTGVDDVMQENNVGVFQAFK